MTPNTRWIAILLATLLAATTATAQDKPAGDADAAPETIDAKPKAMDLDALLQAVQEGWADERAENDRREAAFRDAEAREREAEAEAKATEMVSEAIAKGDVQAVNYFVAQSYVEAFGKLAEAKHQKTVIIPAETAGLVGLLSGITELKGIAGPGTGGGTSGPGGSTSMAGTSVPKNNG